MSVTLGIDLGTSGIKAVLAEGAGRVLGSAEQAIAVSAPHPGWSEQEPDLWCEALGECLDELKREHADLMAAVKAIGLSGQMLGAVIVDGAHRPVRPAILWNDQRAIEQCKTLLERVPDIGRRTNGLPDPGLTAPKLLWLAAHEPEALKRGAMLLLPKDYVRLWLTGEVASEPSDASGTQLMDNAASLWDDALAAAVGWSLEALPPLIEPWAVAGTLRATLAERWGLAHATPVAAGCGDNMACSLGMGVAAPGDSLITIGTSGVVCTVSGAWRPGPEAAILTGVHAAPDAFLAMAVVMSATASFQWAADLTGARVPALAAEADAFVAAGRAGEAPIALPALSGLRTPHNRPDASAVLTGLTGRTDRAALGYAVLEGVAFQFAECVEAQRRVGGEPLAFEVVGGGTRNGLWLRQIATVLGTELTLSDNAHMAAPLGAVRLARIAAGEATPADLGDKNATLRRIAPDPDLAPLLEERFGRYQEMLRQLGLACG